MNRALRFALVSCVAVVAAAFSGCTLILNTEDLITDCTAQEDCEEGFVCEDNACLPEDTDDSAG